ncbi:MAG: SigF/SigG family RNA polymerase sporulation sigma factor [Clostridia bacterium]|nr:SigF/SigG family RNA polymerase sporulation sigma factor [Clostridia bacterium]
MMNDTSRLTYERTIELILLAKGGDSDAMEELVRCNMALVRSIVKKFVNRGVEYDDLYQIGSMGLVKAVKNFDPAYNVRFSTYAVPMIAGEIKRYLRDDGMVKVSRSLKELAGRAAAAQGELSSKLGRDPGIQELAEYMGENPEEISMAMDSSRPHISIYEPVYGDEGDALVMDKLSGSGDGDDDALDRILLQQLMSILEPREQKIIMLRYFRDKTQSEIAASMGISQVQVSRLESRIMKKLRERAAESG